MMDFVISRMMDNYLYPKYELCQLSIKRFEIYVTKV